MKLKNDFFVKNLVKIWGMENMNINDMNMKSDMVRTHIEYVKVTENVYRFPKMNRKYFMDNLNSEYRKIYKIEDIEKPKRNKINFAMDTKQNDGSSEINIQFSKCILKFFKRKIHTHEDVLQFAPNLSLLAYFIDESKILKQKLEYKINFSEKVQDEDSSVKCNEFDPYWDQMEFIESAKKKCLESKKVGIIRVGSREISHSLGVEHLPWLIKFISILENTQEFLFFAENFELV